MTGIWDGSWLGIMVEIQPHTWRLMFRQTWRPTPADESYGDL